MDVLEDMDDWFVGGGKGETRENIARRSHDQSARAVGRPRQTTPTTQTQGRRYTRLGRADAESGTRSAAAEGRYNGNGFRRRAHHVK